MSQDRHDDLVTTYKATLKGISFVGWMNQFRKSMSDFPEFEVAYNAGRNDLLVEQDDGGGDA